jgi:hypothetical protein
MKNCSICGKTLSFWEKMNTLEIDLPSKDMKQRIFGFLVEVELCKSCKKLFKEKILTWRRTKYDEEWKDEEDLEKQLKIKAIEELKTYLEVSK